MTPTAIFFNDALRLSAELLNRQAFPEEVRPLVIRDLHGRIRIALENANKEKHSKLASQLSKGIEKLAAFAGETGKSVLFPEDFFASGQHFSTPRYSGFLFPRNREAIAFAGSTGRWTGLVAPIG